MGNDPRRQTQHGHLVSDAALRREPADTKSSQSKRSYRNFFSILMEPGAAERRTLLTSHDCANIFTSDHHADENSPLEALKTNK